MKRVLAIASLIVLSGCSVAMASKTKGVTLETSQACKSRSCFLALRDVQVMTSTPGADGTLTETYKVLLKKGSAGRAVMHGILDVFTLGAWEVAATPIEGSATKDKFVIVTALFDKDGRVIETAVGDRIPHMAAAPIDSTQPLKPVVATTATADAAGTPTATSAATDGQTASTAVATTMPSSAATGGSDQATTTTAGASSIPPAQSVADQPSGSSTQALAPAK
jgi:hypothetical protein